MMTIFFFPSAFSQNLTNSSGDIISPYYPGYYTNNTKCVWHVTAPKHHVIRVEFRFFRLEEDPVCAKDFVKIHDGNDELSPIIGTYCGYSYPEIVESSFNKLMITFSSNSRGVRTGFKAHYHFRESKRPSCITLWYTTTSLAFTDK